MSPKAEPEPGTVWPPQAYDGKVRFDVWETLLAMYMSAKGYTDEMDDKKVLALLQNIGPATLEKIIDWTAPDKPQTKKYTELIDLLKEKFSVSKNLTALRFKFFTEKQQSGQSLQEYLAHMTQLYGQCTMAEMNPQQFGVLAILQGLADDDLRQYLMKPENYIADTKKVQNLAMNFEQSRRAAKALKVDGGSASGKPFQLNVVGKGYKCGYCGGTHLKGKYKCPANGAICNKCGKKDHFAKVCKSERKQQQNNVEDDEQASLKGICALSVLTVSSNHKESVPPQKQQMDSLKTKLEVETRDLKQAQTRKSMEDTRQIENDRTIASRAEKERRVKETKERSLKLFVEERKRLAMKAEIHQEQLNKRHTEQVDVLDREKSKALEQEKMNHRESILASKPESIV